jgi:phosphate transport system protein
VIIMTKKFHEELDLLKAEVLDMGALATCFLEQSVDAMVKQDVDGAKKVLDARKQIIEKNKKIEQKAIELITLFQPMARDIRLVVAILKIIEDLVRIGRYGKDIAALVEELSQKPHVKKIVHIPQMHGMLSMHSNRESLKASRTSLNETKKSTSAGMPFLGNASRI